VTLRAKLHAKMFFFWGGFLQLATAKAPGRILTQNTPKTRGSAQGCAFSKSRTENLIFRPSFPPIDAILGTIFDGTRKFLPKNRLTMGMLPLQHLLIVIVDAEKWHSE